MLTVCFLITVMSFSIFIACCSILTTAKEKKTKNLAVSVSFVCVVILLASSLIMAKTLERKRASNLRLAKQPIDSVVTLQGYKVIRKYTNSLMSESSRETSYFVDLEDFILPGNIQTKNVELTEDAWANIKVGERLDSKIITEKIKR